MLQSQYEHNQECDQSALLALREVRQLEDRGLDIKVGRNPQEAHDV